MKKQLLSLSIAGAITLAGGISAAFADEDCDGVLVQSRFALANCMIESAVAIAAAAATENGCQAGEWDIETVVPEYILNTIPIQGTTSITGNNGDIVELTGSSSALEQNNVNCRVSSTASGNVFDGKVLTYSPGFNNFYVDAIIDRDSSMLCITESVSSGDIGLGDDDYDESNNLTFSSDTEDGSDIITAAGLIVISESQGQGQGDPGDLSAWTTEEEVLIPVVGGLEEEGFELEAVTDEIGSGCKIDVEASVENLEYWVIEGVSGGLTISGTLEVEPEGAE